jgi:hypothetical protein
MFAASSSISSSRGSSGRPAGAGVAVLRRADGGLHQRLEQRPEPVLLVFEARGE